VESSFGRAKRGEERDRGHPSSVAMQTKLPAQKGVLQRLRFSNRTIAFLFLGLLVSAGLFVNFYAGYSITSLHPFSATVLPAPGAGYASTQTDGTANEFGSPSALLPVPLYPAEPTLQEGYQNDPMVREWASFIHRGATYLDRSVYGNGRFRYLLAGEGGKADSKKYNVLRHAGSIYALAEYYRWFDRFQMPVDVQILGVRPAVVLSSILRATTYLKKAFIKPLPKKFGRSDLLAAWDEPAYIGSPSSKRCAKLGGAGLSLVALASVERIAPGTTPLLELQSLARFIVYMQKKDGSFYSKFFPEGGPNAKWTSLYYPGEAALGLVLLYELDGGVQWLESALNALLYLSGVRRGLGSSVEADHWAMLATRRLIPHRAALGDRYTPEVEEEILVHAGQVVQALDKITKVMKAKKESAPADGRACPIATRLEGMVAVMSFFHGSTKEYRGQVSWIENSSLVATRFLVSSQYREKDLREGGVPRAVLTPTSRHRMSAGDVRRAGEIRIDYVQHAICGVMNFLEYMYSTERFAL